MEFTPITAKNFPDHWKNRFLNTPLSEFYKDGDNIKRNYDYVYSVMGTFTFANYSSCRNYILGIMVEEVSSPQIEKLKVGTGFTTPRTKGNQTQFFRGSR